MKRKWWIAAVVAAGLAQNAPGQVLQSDVGRVEILGLKSMGATELQKTVTDRCGGKW